MYVVTQLNDLEQDGFLYTEFILDDDQNIMPQIRVQKVFKIVEQIDKVVENQKKIDSLAFENQYLINGNII